MSVRASVSQWSNISDSLPEENVDVLICYEGGGIQIAKHHMIWSRQRDKWLICFDVSDGFGGTAERLTTNTEDPDPVEKWMPLPKP